MSSLRESYLSRFLASPLSISEAIDPVDREDGIADGFSIPLDAQARALSAKVKLPMAKRLVSFIYMAGVPGRYMNAEDIEGTIMAAADMLRKKASVRTAFLDLYDRLATVKGHAIPETEPAVQEAEEAKKGNYVQKLFGTVLVELGLPDSLIGVTAPAAVQAGLLKTATEIEQDSGLERALRQLALRLGVKSADVQAKVSEAKKDEEYTDYETYAAWKRAAKAANPDVWFDGDSDIGQAMVGEKPFKRGKTKSIGEWDGEVGCIYNKVAASLKEAVEVGQDEFMNDVVALAVSLGIPEELLNMRRVQLVKSLREKKLTLRNRSAILAQMKRLLQVIEKNTAANGQGDTEE